MRENENLEGIERKEGGGGDSLWLEPDEIFRVRMGVVGEKGGGVIGFIKNFQ